MKKKLLAIIVLILIATLSVAGCTVGVRSTSSPTPTPTTAPTVTTPTPAVDYSSILTKQNEGGAGIMERPYTKSTSERGNDVYKGVGRNATLPGSHSVTLVIELTKLETEAKQVYDKAVNDKVSEGYTVDSVSIAKYKANNPGTIDAWMGTYGMNVFVCSYYDYYSVHGWAVQQQSFSMT